MTEHTRPMKVKGFCNACYETVVTEDATHHHISKHDEYRASASCPQCGKTIFLGLFESLEVSVAEGIPGAVEKLACHREQQQLVLGKINARLGEFAG